MQFRNELDERTYGGASDDWFNQLVVTSDGYALVGNTYSFGAGSIDLWLVKVATNEDSHCNICELQAFKFRCVDSLVTFFRKDSHVTKNNANCTHLRCYRDWIDGSG